MIFLIFILLSTLILLIYLNFKPYIDLEKKLKASKGVLLKVLRSNYEDFYENVIAPIIREKCDTFWLGYNFFLILHNPEDVKIALNSEKCFEKPVFYEFYFKWGLLTIGGEKYKQQRKSLNPIFSPSNLRSLIPKINAKTTEFFENFSDEWGMKNADVKLLASKFSFNTVCKTLAGVEGLDKENLHNFIVDAEDFMQAASERSFKPWLHPDFIYRFSSIFDTRQRHLESVCKIGEEHWENHNAKNNEDLITYFTCMKNLNSKMSMDEYLESIALFLGASYETTAGTIANVILLLAMNQDEQEKVYQEVSSILVSSDDEVTEEKINEMTFLDLVIKETLRMIPNSVVTLRVVTEDIQLSNYVAPKGSILTFPTVEIQRDKSIWGDDALEFRPKRFTEESFKNMHPYAYIPFSNGPRMCPGYKYALITLKIFLSRFIMKYHVSTLSKFEELKLVIGLTLKFQITPEILITKRH